MNDLYKYLETKELYEKPAFQYSPKMDYSRLSGDAANSGLAGKIGAVNQAQQLASSGGGGSNPVGGALGGAAIGAQFGGPKGALIGGAAGLTAGILSAEAQAEKEMRDREAQIAQQLAQNKNQGFQTIYQALQGGFR